jgi:hypothetical protein
MFKSTGWKGMFGGIGLMVVALFLGALKMILPEVEYGIPFAEAMAMFLAGLGLLGIRLKLNG